MKNILSLYKKGPKPSLFDLSTTLVSAKSPHDTLKTLLESRQLTSELTMRSSSWQKATHSIAICLVIVDSLVHEEIWEAWINSGLHSASAASVKLYIHAKHPERIQSEFVRSHLITEHLSPEWNSPEVVRAMLAVLKAAINDVSPCERYIFATESCIPICSLDCAASELFAEDVSWLQAFKLARNKWEAANCFNAVDDRIIPPNAVWKAVPGWIMLTRRHAAEIVALNSTRFAPQLGDLVAAWGPPGPWTEGQGGVFAPEEVFFPTMLALLGYLDSTKLQLAENAEREGRVGSTPREVRLRAGTYVEFERNGDANPKSFLSLSRQLVDTCRSSGALFARKFPRGSVSVEEWRQIVLGESSKLPPVARLSGDRFEVEKSGSDRPQGREQRVHPRHDSSSRRSRSRSRDRRQGGNDTFRRDHESSSSSYDDRRSGRDRDGDRHQSRGGDGSRRGEGSRHRDEYRRYDDDRRGHNQDNRGFR